MTLATKLILIAALVLSIFIPFGYYLLGEKNKGRYKCVVCAPSSRQLKKYRFFATQIMLGSIFMLP